MQHSLPGATKSSFFFVSLRTHHRRHRPGRRLPRRIPAGQGLRRPRIERRNSLFNTDRINEIAWRLGWITLAQFENISKALGKSSYGQYLSALLTGTIISKC